MTLAQCGLEPRRAAITVPTVPTVPTVTTVITVPA